MIFGFGASVFAFVNFFCMSAAFSGEIRSQGKTHGHMSKCRLQSWPNSNIAAIMELF